MASDYGNLRAATLKSGKDEEAVTVNTRALIDKVLARYSGEHTMLRELLQNAADANASHVEIKYETYPNYNAVEPGTDKYKALLKAKCKRMIVKNDGQPFREEDWQRLKRIAEGNPDETKIGAFGVGFYSVFADCEEPFVSSGSEAMAFYWKGNQLFTRRAKRDTFDPNTVFFLENREPSDLPDIKTLCRFLATSITFVTLSSITLFIDNHQIVVLKKKPSPALSLTLPPTLRLVTSGEIMKIASVVTESIQIDATYMQLAQYEPTAASEASSGVQSFRAFFSKFSSHAHKPAPVEDLSEKKTANIFLRIASATVRTTVPEKIAQELERATKKPPPRVTKIAMLSMSKAELDASEKGIAIFENIYPHKEGKIFIGFPTHQTTAIKAHISAHSVIPTVERESIDLNARIVKTWNAELLQCAGILARIMYTDEMNTLQQMARGMTPTEIEKLYPTATHIMNQFTFTTATPSAEVGRYIEHGFWTCGKKKSIELLSNRGVFQSSEIRTATNLSFLDDLAILPKQLEEGSPVFIETLRAFDWISEVSVEDIRVALDKKALSKSQALAFLKWLAHQNSQRLIVKADAERLLEVAVVMDAKSEVPICLDDIKFALDPQKFPPSIPIPPDCAPFDLTKTLTRSELDAIGWIYMDLPHWVGYLCNGRFDLEHDILLNPEFAQTMLVIISKNWSHQLGNASKAKIIDLLRNKACIVTRQGMKRPDEAYLEKIKLFEDLPIVVPHNGVKSTVLAELGVRKTVELRLIFDRLMSDEKGAKWSHVDLIKYLSSVRSDIPDSDLEMLKNSPTCLAEGDTKRHAIKDLYQPDDNLRMLNFPIISWPDEWRPNSAEVRFLESLGLKKHPSVEDILQLACNVSDVPLRSGALRYLINNYYANMYVNANASVYQRYAFLPAENSEKGKLYRPQELFTNKDAAIFQFPLLRADLIEHATKFSVRTDPPVEAVINHLFANPPKMPEDATAKFKYLSGRMTEIGTYPKNRLQQAAIVPVKRKHSDGTIQDRMLRPGECFIGGEGSPYKDIFDFVDFGSQANAFLLFCGSKNEPSISELAYRVASEPDKVLSTFGDQNKYLVLLKMIYNSFKELKRDKTLILKMQTAPMLLAYREVKSNPNEKGGDAPLSFREYKLATSQEITIIDDFISYELFKSEILAAPQDDDLEAFYARLGAVHLSAKIAENHNIGLRVNHPKLCADLKKLIVERTRLFLHSNKEPVQHTYKWIDKSVTVECVDRIKHRRELILGTKRIHHERTVTAAVVYRNRQPIIHVTPEFKFFDLAQVLVGLILIKAPAHSSLVMESLLSTDLYELRNRGVNVDRILEAKQEEARLAEEMRLKRVEEDKKKLAEQERKYQQEQKEVSKSEKQVLDEKNEKVTMPGAFQDSPPPRKPAPPPPVAPEPTGSLFKRFTQRFGLENDRRQEESMQSLNKIADSSKSMASQSTTSVETAAPDSGKRRPEKPTSAHRISQNLHNAIESTRAHNSDKVVSKGKSYDVKEEATYCDSTPATNIIFVAETATGMKVFLHKELKDSTGEIFTAFMGKMNEFSILLKKVADIYNLSISSLHMFYDESGSTIAFNASGALFFNFRFYQQLHCRDDSSVLKKQALVYWFTVAAHELAHNLVGPHNAEHSFYTESFVQEYFLRVLEKLPKD